MNQSKVIRDYETKVRALAGKFSSNSAEREDLAQEGFIALIDAAERYKAEFESRLWAYAYKGVVGAMVDYQRRFAIPNSTDGAAMLLASGDDTPESALAAAQGAQASAETLARVMAALVTLTDEERAIVERVCAEGQSLRQVSEETGRNRRTVTKRYESALAVLRKAAA